MKVRVEFYAEVDVDLFEEDLDDAREDGFDIRSLSVDIAKKEVFEQGLLKVLRVTILED